MLESDQKMYRPKIVRAPSTKKMTIRTGTQRGLSSRSRAVGAVYRDDSAMPELVRAADARVECSPGRVPLGVTRPVVFLLGGATGDESTLPPCPALVFW